MQSRVPGFAGQQPRGQSHSGVRVHLRWGVRVGGGPHNRGLALAEALCSIPRAVLPPPGWGLWWFIGYRLNRCRFFRQRRSPMMYDIRLRLSDSASGG